MRLDVGDERVELLALHQREDVGCGMVLEFGAHDASPARSSSFSIARTGTRNRRPTLMVGMSPRSAARYEPLRPSPKYFFPASGTVIVSGGSLLIVGSPVA